MGYFEDLFKPYELAESGRSADPRLASFIRLDGKGFSKYTKHMNQPFDKAFSEAMVETTKVLVDEFEPTAAFVGSDEITLYFRPLSTEELDSGRTLLFGGRMQKLCSLAAGRASVEFYKRMMMHPSAVGTPYFDARMFQTPVELAQKAILWRHYDVSKNAISKVAAKYMSHKESMGVATDAREALVEAKEGTDWRKNYKEHDLYGSFIVRKKVFKHLPPETLAKIPEKHRPNGPIERTETIVTSDVTVLNTLYRN